MTLSSCIAIAVSICVDLPPNYSRTECVDHLTKILCSDYLDSNKDEQKDKDLKIPECQKSGGG